MTFPTSENLASSLLAQLLSLCEQLHICSDDELQAQLHQLTFAQPEQMVQSVRLLLHSSQYIQQRAPQHAPSPAPANAAATEPVLSVREQEVLALLAQGYSLPRIGSKLFISPATVNNHCARMREKLGLRGCKTLVLYACSLKASHSK